MIDEEKLGIDIAEAIGKASASIAMTLSLMALLKEKGLITEGDGATSIALAQSQIDAMKGLPADAAIMAESAIRGATKAWTKRLTKQ